MALRRMFPVLALVVLAVAAVHPAAADEAADRCGNGVLDDGEACDDGNRRAGDCCAPDCRIEESHLGCAGACLCATCDDGVDNDGNGRTDAEDPQCATLASLQRFARVDPAAAPAAAPADGTVTALPAAGPAAFAGSPVAGRCDRAAAACVCPEMAPDCQPAGRPCAADADCEPVPYPAGASRAWVCDAANAAAPACIAAARQAQGEIDHLLALRGQPLALPDASAGAPAEVQFGPGTHVVDVDEVRVEDGAQLVLAGDRETVVVLRVRGAVALGHGAAVTAGGDLAADRILWVVAAGGAFRAGDAARFVGTLLADARAAVALGAGVTWEGAILGAAPPS